MDKPGVSGLNKTMALKQANSLLSWKYIKIKLNKIKNIEMNQVPSDKIKRNFIYKPTFENTYITQVCITIFNVENGHGVLDRIVLCIQDMGLSTP